MHYIITLWPLPDSKKTPHVPIQVRFTGECTWPCEGVSGFWWWSYESMSSGSIKFLKKLGDGLFHKAKSATKNPLMDLKSDLYFKSPLTRKKRIDGRQQKQSTFSLDDV